MECDICSKGERGLDDFICATCARSFIYLSRLEVARMLLENERLNQQISTVIDGTSESAGPPDPSLKHAQGVWKEEMMSAERSATKGRIEETQTHVASLKANVEELRLELSRRRENLAARKKAMDTIERTIPARRSNTSSAMMELREKGTVSFGSISSRSGNTRAFLCRETATLLRLRQRKKQKNGMIWDQYSITGLTLPDLKDINNIRCTDLTASLTSTAHLLVLVAFYLGIRLPAEITAPYRDYPLPTINTPAHSYLGHKVPFPGSGSISAGPSSPFSSKHDIKVTYRPRPLFIGSDDREEKVAQFAKRDQLAFNFFVEGVSLLAWNIAWLCRTQGFSQGTNAWEDICDMGRNLYQLIFSQPQSPAMLRVLSNRETQKRRTQNSGSSTPVQNENNLSFAKLGQTSHSSAHSFLNQASFNEQLRSWKFSTYNTISDALKKLLVTEMNNAEWELLEEQEWDDGGEQFDEAVVVKARATDAHDFDDARSIMTAKTAVEDRAQQSGTERDSVKPKGTSGWTKVKSRNDT